VYDDAVTSADLDDWDHEFDALMARVRPLFYRVESKKHAEQYIRGLLSPLARKNGWTISEYVGEPEPTTLQRLLNLSPWDVDELLALTRQYAMENFAGPGGILVADPTGFPKKGRKSVGVQRQYSGDAGTDRQLPDRHVLGVRDPAPGPGTDRSPTVPAGAVVAGRPGPLRRGRRPPAGHLPDPTPAGPGDDRVGAGGRVLSAWFTADEEFARTPACATTSNVSACRM
jgi:hypothetical protein